MPIMARILAIAAAAALFGSAGAQAAVLFDAPAAIPQQADNTDYLVNFAAPGGLANLSFTINGYASLDGQNWYEDDFTLTLNGLDIFRGTWNLGGGGADAIYLNPLGFTANNISGNGTDVTWAGGQVNVAGVVNLIAGTNTLKFNYSALPYNEGQNAGWQDMGDESWGVEKILVTTAGVPEPASWALMIGGFGLAGAALRRRRAMAVTA
jgi:hypothetical protein